jgi:glutathione S-transferase
MSKFVVYGTSLSTYVRTVQLLLEEINVKYQIYSIDFLQNENKLAEYLAKNPFVKMPALEIEEGLIYETSAITDYLDTVLANGQFTPTDPLIKARMRQIIGIIDHYFYPNVITVVMQGLIVPSQGGQSDLGVVSEAIEMAKTAIEAIESLVICNPYLLGNEVSISDLYLVPIFVYLAQVQEFTVVTAQTPNLRNWWEQISQLSIVKKVCT